MFMMYTVNANFAALVMATAVLVLVLLLGLARRYDTSEWAHVGREKLPYRVYAEHKEIATNVEVLRWKREAEKWHTAWMEGLRRKQARIDRCAERLRDCQSDLIVAEIKLDALTSGDLTLRRRLKFLFTGRL